MNLSPILDQAAIYIGYDVANDWLYVDWKEVHTQESSQQACLLMLEAMCEHRCAKILNDNSNITHTSVELTSWGVWWMQEMRRAGLQYIAWVLPRSFAGRQRAEHIVQHVEQPTIATFDDVASAYWWLKQQTASATTSRYVS